jgi:hypothetical protein
MMMNQPELKFKDESQERSDAITVGMMDVIAAEKEAWRIDYEELFLQFAKKHDYFEGGHVCRALRKAGLRNPHHHNVWGAMLNSMAKKGYILKVGNVTPTTSHTHIAQVGLWESSVYVDEEHQLDYSEEIDALFGE